MGINDTRVIIDSDGNQAIVDRATSALFTSAAGAGGAGVALPSAVQWTPAPMASAWPVQLSGGLLSAWAVPAGTLTVSAQLSAGGTVNTALSSVLRVIDPNNSITGTSSLASGATFTGASSDTLNFAHVAVNIFANASGTLSAEFGPDGTNWDHIHVVGVSANLDSMNSFVAHHRYFRLEYQQGGVSAGTLRLATVLNPGTPTSRFMSLDQTPLSKDGASTVRSVLTGKTTQGASSNYIDVKVNPAGTLQVQAAINDGTNPLAITATSAALISAAGQPTVSAQLSAGGAVSAFTAGQIISAWALPLATQTPFMVSGTLSAVTVGSTYQNVSGGPVVVSAIGTLPVSAANTAAISGTVTVTTVALSSQFPNSWVGGSVASSVPITELTATSSIIPLSSGFRTYVYAWSLVPRILVISAGALNFWWKLQASGTATSDLTGYEFVGQPSAGAFPTMGIPHALAAPPPGYLIVGPANSAVALNISSVSAGFFSLGGFLAFWRAT